MLLRKHGFPFSKPRALTSIVGNIGLTFRRNLSGSGRLSLIAAARIERIGATLRSVDGKSRCAFCIACQDARSGLNILCLHLQVGGSLGRRSAIEQTTELKGGVQLIQASRVREDLVNLGPALRQSGNRYYGGGRD